jgi:putative flavoprotein involved in K+ transport
MTNPVLDVIVIGAGHAGLSASYYLKKHHLTHLVFERGQIGNSWRSQRWDNFKLNTANKINVLPGFGYHQSLPDGFATAKAFAGFLQHYVARFNLPVVENAVVVAIEKQETAGLFFITAEVEGDTKSYFSRQVIIASGTQTEIKIPVFAHNIDTRITQLHSSQYRSAAALPPGAVLVVGSAQSGCQIAEDLADAGRKVFLSTSRVGRVPRHYRGKDIMDWLISTSFFDMKPGQVPDATMLHAAAPQLSGTTGGTISLQSLAKKGITVLGKIENAAAQNILLQPNAAWHVQFADEFSATVKAMVDEFIESNNYPAPAAEIDEADMPDVNSSCASSVASIHLQEENINSIIWATGFANSFDYLKIPVFDRDKNPVHQNGITAEKGLFFLGLPWLRKRKSSLIYGITEDAKFICGQVYINAKQKIQ